MGPLRCISSVLLLFVFFTLLSGKMLSAQDFSIIVLPDTQNEAQFDPQVLSSQTQWIAANAASRNIQMVLGVGDIVNNASDNAQQQNADASFRVLDNANIPYMLAIGNHDYDNAAPKSRGVVGFNQWFGPSRYAAKTYYKGNFPSGSNENFYGFMTISGRQYLFMVLEFRPRSNVLDWAESILSANPDKEAIIVTHSYLRMVGTREDQCDTQDMPYPANATGQQMWERFRKHPNVVMTLNGHFTGGSVANREDISDSGTLVNQIFADLQDYPNGGDGWLLIITVHPASDTISVQTYSPFLNQFMTGANQQFTVPYHNPKTQTGAGAISGKVRNPSTCAAISGVTVHAGNASAVTASDGTYKISVPPGSYSVSASGSGWNTQTLSETVSDALTTQLDFYLTPGSGSSPPCTLNTASPSVTICTPANNATVTLPVQVVAGTTDSTTVSFVQAYLDGSAVVTQTGKSLNASISMSAGTHRLTVQAKDTAGVVFKQTINVTAGAPPTPTPTPTPVPSPTPNPTPTPTPNPSPTPTPTPSPTPTPTPKPSPTPTPVPTACTATGVSPSVTICSPANSAVVSSPVHVVAASKDTVAVSFLQIYVDGSPVLTKTGSTLDTTVAMASGARRVTVQAKDANGTIFKQTINITVK